MKHVTNVTDSVCSIDRCNNPSFAHCLIDGIFKGKICEECYGRNEPLWRDVQNKEIEDWHKQQEDK
jgi:hypothetical protein